jgi:hypothetical protein
MTSIPLAAGPAALRSAQRTAILDALAEAALEGKPGVSAYGLGIEVPVPQPPPGTAVLGVSASLGLTLGLLAELERAGSVRREPGDAAATLGGRWQLTGPAVLILPCFGVGGRVVLVGGRGRDCSGSAPGWCVRYLDGDGSRRDDVFTARVVADRAAEAIRSGSGYDWPAFHGRDLALREGRH